jgi:4-amino-4-deoxy-L-arabinose transferase-like glycosyltransferase
MSRQTGSGPAHTNPIRIRVGRSGRQSTDAILAVAGRLVGAGLLAAMAGIHLHLYGGGYRGVPTIGPLFLLNGVLGLLAAIAVLVTPRRWLGWFSVAGAGLQAGTLGALILSLTVGLFDFTESTRAPLVWTTIAVESTGAVVLLALAVRELWPRLRGVVAGRRAR